jgi:hypothetical protein
MGRDDEWDGDVAMRNIWKVLAIGAVIGGIVAALRKRGDGPLADQARGAAGQAQDVAADVVAKGKDVAGDVVAKGKDMATEAVAAAKAGSNTDK